MYIGLPGSGKSTIAAAQKGVTIISSDAIRNELYGDENILGKHNEVFELMLRRTREALLKGESVCYDATNPKGYEKTRGCCVGSIQHLFRTQRQKRKKGRTRRNSAHVGAVQCALLRRRVG